MGVGGTYSLMQCSRSVDTTSCLVGVGVGVTYSLMQCCRSVDRISSLVGMEATFTA